MTATDHSLQHLISVASTYADEIGEEIFLVGGAIRDILLGNIPTELDLLIQGNAFALAHELANHADSKVVEIDSQYQLVYRVPLPDGGIDVIETSESLRDNLGFRDFTINSMAVPVKHISDKEFITVGNDKILDPFSGQQDIQDRVIRMTNKSVFADDPIRAIRAARFIGQFDFEVEPATMRQLTAVDFRTDMVSPDRLSRELVLLFQSKHYLKGLEFLAATGILAELFPYLRECMTQDQSAPHILNVYDHQLQAARYLEQIVGERDLSEVSSEQVARTHPELNSELQKLIPSGHPLASLRMAVLLHDVGKPSTANFVDGKWRFFDHPGVGANILRAHLIRCRFSNEFVESITLLVQNHMRLGQLIELGDHVSERAIFRLHRDVGKSIGSLALLYLSDTFATVDSNESTEAFLMKQTRLLTIVNWEPSEAAKQLNSWINGETVMELLGIGPGPEVGQILDSLELATVDGLIKSETDARNFVADLSTNGM
tara:strand:- start:97 stop:1563 length:1467 start_codon:yes stop_codon:yes gene_type:complete